jgi:hypothetical protein
MQQIDENWVMAKNINIRFDCDNNLPIKFLPEN